MHTAPKATFIGGARQVVTYLFRELPVPVAHGSHPLLVVRGDDREVSAFLDVCRHRGTRSEDAPCGHEKKAFVCPYPMRGRTRVTATCSASRTTRASPGSIAAAAPRARRARPRRGWTHAPGSVRSRTISRASASPPRTSTRRAPSRARSTGSSRSTSSSRRTTCGWRTRRRSTPSSSTSSACRSGRPAPAERLPEAHHRDARLAWAPTRKRWCSARSSTAMPTSTRRSRGASVEPRAAVAARGRPWQKRV